MSGARHWALVPAAGAGRRMGSTVPKQYLPLLGRPVIAHALTILLDHPRIDGVVVAIDARDEWWPTVVAGLDAAKLLPSARGGAERCHSVLNGLETLRERAAPNDWVLVHDAARPCIGTAELDRLLAARDHPVGALLALPVADTLKRANARGESCASIDRAGAWRAQTPQMFRRGELAEALARAIAEGEAPTDEAAAFERLQRHPLLVPGDARNLKVTSAEDLALAEWWLARPAG